MSQSRCVSHYYGRVLSTEDIFFSSLRNKPEKNVGGVTKGNKTKSRTKTIFQIRYFAVWEKINLLQNISYIPGRVLLYPATY